MYVQFSFWLCFIVCDRAATWISRWDEWSITFCYSTSHPPTIPNHTMLHCASLYPAHLQAWSVLISPRGLTFPWWGCYGLCLTYTNWACPLLSILFLCLFFSVCPFNCILFHKSSRQLSIFTRCFFFFFFPGLISALLVFSTIYLFMKVSFSPDIIPSGWLGLKLQLTNQLFSSAHMQWEWLPLSSESVHFIPASDIFSVYLSGVCLCVVVVFFSTACFPEDILCNVVSGPSRTKPWTLSPRTGAFAFEDAVGQHVINPKSFNQSAKDGTRTQACSCAASTMKTRLSASQLPQTSKMWMQLWNN